MAAVTIKDREFRGFKPHGPEELSSIVIHEKCGNLFMAGVLYQVGVCPYCNLSQDARIYGAQHNNPDPTVTAIPA